MRSDICIINIRQLWGQPFFFSCDWTKNNGERKKKRENKNICEYERGLFQELSKNSCTNIISHKIYTIKQFFYIVSKKKSTCSIFGK